MTACWSLQVTGALQLLLLLCAGAMINRGVACTAMLHLFNAAVSLMYAVLLLGDGCLQKVAHISHAQALRKH